MAFNRHRLHLEVNQLLIWREEGKISFDGTLFHPDGSIDLPQLSAVREKWRLTRTLIAHNNRSVELPQELSEADCTSSDLREFYSRYPETAETVVFKPGERFKDALSRQPQDVKDARTLILRQKMMQNIMHGAWCQLRDNVEEILNVDPLNRRSPSPVPEDWSIPDDAFDDAASSSPTAPFQPFDPDFDWGTLRRSPDVSIKVEIKKEE
jgi:hypothetical protein